MSWWDRATTTINRPSETADEEEARSAEAESPRPARAAARGGLAAPVFAGVVLALAVGLAVWAPWREEPLAVSDFGTRAEAVAPPTAISAITATPRATPAGGGAASQPAAPSPTARAADTARPVGLPLKRTDWIIVRDYVATGGPGPRGAVDIGVVGNRDALGTPVYATHDGTVKILRDNRIYGNLVAVKNSRWSTTYGYLDQVLVSDGQSVRRGDQIGTLGRSGQATGPMLDYQVWEQVGAEEVNRNPMDSFASR